MAVFVCLPTDFRERKRKSKVVPGRDLYCACYVSLPLFLFFFKIVFIDEILYLRPIPPPTSRQYPSEITPVSRFITLRASVSPHLFPWCLILRASCWLKVTGTWSFCNDSARIALACRHVPALRRPCFAFDYYRQMQTRAFWVRALFSFTSSTTLRELNHRCRSCVKNVCGSQTGHSCVAYVCFALCCFGLFAYSYLFI